MYSPSWRNSINKIDILPPMTVSQTVKKGKPWQKAVMSAFEHIGREQFLENRHFWDYYRMIEGKMSIVELKQAVPHLEKMADLLESADIPAFLKHYDLLGGIIRDIVGKYVDFQDKFHVVDTGEIAENEFLRFKNEEIFKTLNAQIEDEVKRMLASKGYTLEGKKFESTEEQQAYMQEMEEAKRKATPKDTLAATNSKFKTIGMQWGEATLDRDKERFGLQYMEQRELTDKLLTGRCFREYKIGYDSYTMHTWSPKNTFISKEISTKLAQKGDYIGRWHPMTPQEFIRKHGLEVPTDIQRKLLGGNKEWKSFIGNKTISGTIDEAINNNYNKASWVPFDGSDDYDMYLGIQDDFGVPMGTATWFDADGTEKVSDRYLPRHHSTAGSGFGKFLAQTLRSDFKHRDDLCQVTEVYFVAQELWGLLSYESESGLLMTEEVTEDILPQFLQEKGIKQTFKSSLVDVMRDANSAQQIESNTIKWIYRPVVYEGLQISSPALEEDYVVYCRPMAYQIKGDSDFEVILPVAGYVGQAFAPKIMPYQSAFNLVMNQIYNLLEKEIGIFFLLDVTLIPSEIDGWGDAKEAMIEMRNLAKDIGILPVQTSGDAQKNQNNFNQFTTYNMTYAPQIQNRMALADKYKMMAFETLGANPQAALQPTKYETAEGVRVSNEASTTQIAELYQEFGEYNQGALDIHLAVAQYCQSNKKDLTVAYTKSDASMAYLKLSDPKFNLRKIGVMPAKDSKKRKEFEQYKQWLLNNNTVGADELSMAKLISSDAMSEAVEIALEGVKRRQEAEQQAHARNMELEDKRAENQKAKDAADFEKDIIKLDKTNNAKIVVGQLNAEGRAADKQADEASFAQIERTSKNALEQTKVDNDKAFKDRSLDIQEKAIDVKKQESLLKLRKEIQDQRLKLELKNKDVAIAAMNKN